MLKSKKEQKKGYTWRQKDITNTTEIPIIFSNVIYGETYTHALGVNGVSYISKFILECLFPGDSDDKAISIKCMSWLIVKLE